MNKKHTIALTGGGSGGHILPLISLLQMIDDTRQYRQVVDNIYRFGEKSGMEYKFFAQYSSTFQSIAPHFISILAGKYRRETIWISRWKNFRDIFVFPCGVMQSLYWLLVHRIDIVFCKGGYVSLPVVIAAWILRKKIYVHDSDTTPGLTTRFASYFATQNFSGFPDTLCDTIPVGQILSDQLIAYTEPLGYSPKRQILIAGGSLGAKKLYDGVIAAIKLLSPSQLDTFHFTFINGCHLVDPKSLVGYESFVTITSLITDQSTIGRLYAQSDLAIVRGGTTTLAECKLFDLPLVIVPLPVTHDQAKNAQYYVETYADICISQNSIDFIQLIYNSLVVTKKKPSGIDVNTIKNIIQKAKIIILDTMLLQ